MSKRAVDGSKLECEWVLQGQATYHIGVVVIGYNGAHLRVW